MFEENKINYRTIFSNYMQLPLYLPSHLSLCKPTIFKWRSTDPKDHNKEYIIRENREYGNKEYIITLKINHPEFHKRFTIAVFFFYLLIYKMGKNKISNLKIK